MSNQSSRSPHIRQCIRSTFGDGRRQCEEPGTGERDIGRFAHKHGPSTSSLYPVHCTVHFRRSAYPRCEYLQPTILCVLDKTYHLDDAPTVSLIKSKQRIADHGEVFTPAWMVEAMLDLVKEESERIDSRFLEPACGSGNFLIKVVERKLDAVERKYGTSEFERRHYALLALMCTYGIELLADNIAECRANLLRIFTERLNLDMSDDLHRAAAFVLSQNLVHGDALTMRTIDDQPITFAEWGYLGKGKFQRRDFRFDTLSQTSAFSAEGTLFADLGAHDIFTPTTTYPPMTVSELADASDGDTHQTEV